MPVVPQDLHIHTTFSTLDSAVVPEQTVSFVRFLCHANVIGISDHLDYVSGKHFLDYERTVRQHELLLGIEVDGAHWVAEGCELPVDYYVYHCRDHDEDYRGVEKLLATERPVIIAHPLFLGTDPGKLPTESVVEVNNRYVWRSDWRNGYAGFLDRFRFVISSDAHQPNWLNQQVARKVADELGIKETLLFPQ